MIVRSTPHGLQLVTQPDHAQLARRIMERCAPLHACSRRDSILLAIGEHDNGWAEVDAAPTLDATRGEVLDFVHLPLAQRQGVWPRGIARLRHDPWAAALVAHHAWTVYGRFRGVAEWTGFFAEMAATRDERLRASGLSFDELAADYAYLRLGDLISLAFCTGNGDELGFAEWKVQLSGTRVVVTPDAFAGAVVTFTIAAREVHGGPFRSPQEWDQAWAAARMTTLRGEAAGTPG